MNEDSFPSIVARTPLVGGRLPIVEMVKACVRIGQSRFSKPYSHRIVLNGLQIGA